MERRDIAIIGAGPAGCAAAIRAARGGARVVVFEKGPYGRDKVCGDGLTPRAVGALRELKVEPEEAHRIDGLRMIAGRTTRELAWPTTSRFPDHGAVLPRRRLDAHLADAAQEAGAEILWETAATPVLDDSGRVTGVEAADGRRWDADLVILAAGAPGAAARLLGADRMADEPFGLAIRTYVPSPRHDDRHLEACLTLTDDHGVAVPGYGWMFPAGDGTVNIGVGALSTMKGFTRLNLNRLLDSYSQMVRESWDIGEPLERPRAWRLPMSAQHRHGPGWLAVGDAAGLVNPMNGEGIDYGLESGILAADLHLESPATAPARYDAEIGERFDAFLRTGRRFSFLIGHPWILRNGLRVAVGTQVAADITLAVMGNLVDSETPGAAGRVLRLADRALATADPLLRRTRAAR
ncbi:NAD(P)/FAD-dependent oxidoreductase [Actinomarinicola tropica]|uniref:NAD(P)/FAD-dependent oxidoreductase n=1 Tax=Actinomarinicola tropica TaxID=2789776 RepID=UPI0018993DBA|nr:geranylgeranyl reductase family protein [Actinomarinicola tropica]